MRAPLSWLRDYAPLEAGRDRAGRRPIGLGPGRRRRRRGRRRTRRRRGRPGPGHPGPSQAERIRLVDVDAGDGDTLQIVCGAWNFAVGDLVPLAPVGCGAARADLISPGARCGASGPTACCARRPSWACPTPEGRRRAADPAGRAGRAGHAAGRGPRICTPTWCSTSTSAPTGPMRCAWPAWPGTWLPPWASRGPCPPSRAPVAVDPALGTAPVMVEAGDLCPRFTGHHPGGGPRRPVAGLSWPAA